MAALITWIMSWLWLSYDTGGRGATSTSTVSSASMLRGLLVAGSVGFCCFCSFRVDFPPAVGAALCLLLVELLLTFMIVASLSKVSFHINEEMHEGS